MFLPESKSCVCWCVDFTEMLPGKSAKFGVDIGLVRVDSRAMSKST